MKTPYKTKTTVDLEKRIRKALAEYAKPVTLAQFQKKMKAIAVGR